ncbi:MAG: hypothetical protein CNCCGFBP_01672 [Fimbriimonadaceae bacterium]|nr:hypothetical protein [Fimbriimonadaceae bacterium]
MGRRGSSGGLPDPANDGQRQALDLPGQRRDHPKAAGHDRSGPVVLRGIERERPPRGSLAQRSGDRTLRKRPRGRPGTRPRRGCERDRVHEGLHRVPQPGGPGLRSAETSPRRSHRSHPTRTPLQHRSLAVGGEANGRNDPVRSYPRFGRTRPRCLRTRVGGKAVPLRLHSREQRFGNRQPCGADGAGRARSRGVRSR